MNNLQFDQYQFAGRRGHTVDAEYTQDGWSSTGISYDDFGRMQSRPSSVSLRHPRWKPAFAASDEQLRHVLLHRAWLYLHGRAKSLPSGDWKTLSVTATKRAIEQLPAFFRNCAPHKRRESEAHVAAVKRAGGYLELQGAIAYRAWRLGEDSVAVGVSLGISPESVRVNLQRLCDIARDLGYETFPHHRTWGRRKTRGGPETA